MFSGMSIGVKILLIVLCFIVSVYVLSLLASISAALRSIANKNNAAAACYTEVYKFVAKINAEDEASANRSQIKPVK